MDKFFSTPRDVGNASPEDLARALNRVLRSVAGPTSFLYQAEFEYANGRRAPLLMVGALRGAWREYIRRNAGAPGFAAGECTVHRDDGGRLAVDLVASRGRAATASHARAINAALMRRVGGEVRFVETGSSTAVRSAPPSPGPATEELSPREPQMAAEPASLAAEAKAILSDFNEFKARPTVAKLEALNAAIERWKKRRESASAGPIDLASSQRIDKIEQLLGEKGRAYVARAKGS